MRRRHLPRGVERRRRRWRGRGGRVPEIPRSPVDVCSNLRSAAARARLERERLGLGHVRRQRVVGEDALELVEEPPAREKHHRRQALDPELVAHPGERVHVHLDQHREGMGPGGPGGGPGAAGRGRRRIRIRTRARLRLRLRLGGVGADEGLELRREDLARAAPVGVEVEHDGRARSRRARHRVLELGLGPRVDHEGERGVGGGGRGGGPGGPGGRRGGGAGRARRGGEAARGPRAGGRRGRRRRRRRLERERRDDEGARATAGGMMMTLMMTMIITVVIARRRDRRCDRARAGEPRERATTSEREDPAERHRGRVARARRGRGARGGRARCGVPSGAVRVGTSLFCSAGRRMMSSARAAERYGWHKNCSNHRVVLISHRRGLPASRLAPLFSTHLLEPAVALDPYVSAQRSIRSLLPPSHMMR